MDPRDSLPIRFCVSTRAKILAYALALALALLLDRGWQPFLLLLLPLGLDILGARLIRADHPAFLEDVLDTLETECLAACGIDEGEPHYASHECEGGIDHWMLRGLPTEAKYALMAPKSDMVVLAARTGRIFPPKSYAPVTYDTRDAGTRDIYYADVTAVELAGCELKMSTTSGETITYAGKGERANEAVERLRERLRAFKSRRPVVAATADDMDAEPPAPADESAC